MTGQKQLSQKPLNQQQIAQKLRLLLASASAKEASGAPLTTREEELLAQLAWTRNEQRRQKITFGDKGEIHVKHTIDAGPVLDAIKAYGDLIDRHTQRDRPQRYVGSLDPVTATNWAKEFGLKIGTKEFAAAAMKRIKNDGAYRKFKVGG